MKKVKSGVGRGKGRLKREPQDQVDLAVMVVWGFRWEIPRAVEDRPAVWDALVISYQAPLSRSTLV